MSNAAATSDEPNVIFKPKWLSTESYGLILLLSSAFFVSGMGVFLKLASSTGLPPMQLVFMRALFQGSIIVICMMFFRCETDAHGPIGERILFSSPLGGTTRVRNILFARGAIGGMSFVFVYYTTSVLPLGDAFTLISLYPIATVFLARIVLNEPIRILSLVVAVASVCGAVLIASPSFLTAKDDASTATEDDDNVNPLGYVTGILGACCASGVVTLIRKAGMVGAHTLQLLFAWATFGLFLSGLFGILLAYGNETERWRLPPNLTSWLYVLAMCSIGSVGHFLLNYAGRLAPAAVGSIVRSSDIMWAYLWQVLVFHKEPSTMTCIGVTLITLSLIAIAIQKFRDEKKNQTTTIGMTKIPTMDTMEEEEAIEMGCRKDEESSNTNPMEYSRVSSVQVDDILIDGNDE